MKTKLLLLLLTVFTISGNSQTRIATGANGSRGIVVNGDYVYTMNGSNLLRADKNQVGTNNFQTVSSGFNSLTNGYNLDELNDIIYIPGGGASGVRTSYIGGAIPTSNSANVNTSGSVSTVYLYNNELYFASTNPSNNSQHELRKATGLNSHVFVASLPVSHQAIGDMTMDGSDLYFTFTGSSSSNNGAIYKIDLAATTPTAQLVKSGLAQPWGIHFVNDYLYFISSASTGYIRKIHKSGTGAVSFVGQSMSSPRGIDIDGQDIYIGVVGTQPGIYKYTDTSLPCDVNIPDVNFKNYLINNTAINTNGDTEIQCSEASAFTGQINCSGLNISDMTGIEAFTALTDLRCQLNNLSSIDVSNNTALTLLWVQFNSLTSLDVSNNTLLENLSYASNSLTFVDTSTNTALKELYAYSNPLTNLDISNNTALELLWCNSTQRTSLDISNHSSLTRLLCHDNSLTSLNVANGVNSSFVTFEATGNPNLTCITVDDVAYSDTNWPSLIDPQTSFSTNCNASVAGITYVNHAATGNNDGTSWADAYTHLETALAAATDGDEFWLATGTYLPNTTGSQTSPFSVNNADLKIYGGFAGTETQLSHRVLGTNETILSGDFNNNDVFPDDNFVDNFNHATKTDNSHNIINITAAGNNLVLDGLTISNAHYTTNNVSGAIMKEKTVSNLTLKNCTIKNNISAAGSGLVAEFELNNASSGTPGTFTIENCIFKNNMSRFASGIFSSTKDNTDVDIIVENTLFDNNISGNLSTGIRGLSGAASWFRATGTSADVNLKLINNTYVNNICDSDGNSISDANRATVIINKTAGAINAEVVNCIFWNNYRPNFPSTVAMRSFSDTYQTAPNSIVVKNSIDQLNFNDSSITSTTNTNDANPLFTNINNDFTLQSGSPAIDTGDNSYVTTASDLLGNQRVFNTTVDMGVYEFGSSTLSISDFELDRNNIKIYPNPTTTVLNIKMESSLKQITIYSVLGKEVLRVKSKTINVTNLRSGIYVIKIEDENGYVTSKRFVKN